MAELDKLSIAISTDVSLATRSLNSLAKSIDKVSASLGSLNTVGLNGFSSSIRSLSSSLSEFKGSSKEADKFNSIAAGIKKFTNIKTEELNKVSSAIEPLARGISSFNTLTFDSKGISSFINSITRLSKANLGSLSGADFTGIENNITGLANALSGAATIDSKTQSLVNSITRLANAGEKSTAVKANLPAIRSEVRAFAKDMARVPVAAKETATMVQAIAQLANAGAKSETTAKNLNILAIKTKNFIRVLSTAPEVSKGTVQLVTAIGQIASAGSRANGAFNGITNSGNRNIAVMSKLGGAFKKLIPGMNRVKKSGKGLASSFGMFYAKFFLVIRAIKALGGAVGSAQDYIEDFNYFSVALDKIGKDSADQFKKAGYDSAEEYADSFRGRFGKLQKQMTGYTVDTDTGSLSRGLEKNLGLDISQVMSFQGAIAQITNSAGMLGETSIMTSKALSMLSADWSSLSNTDLADVMKNMQSALIGQSRSVYKFGIDITAAGLAQTAMNHGLKVNIKDLSQSSKMQLRLLTILEQSKVAYGDLARTINQPANQLRMLEAGFKNLTRSIGALFLPIIQKIYPYLNAVVIVLQEFVDWIAKLTGADLGKIGGGISTPDFGLDDAADDSAAMADNTKKAAKESKKISDNLQGFDIINKLSEDDDNDNDNKAANAGNQNLDLSGDIKNALKNYTKIWNKAFKDSENNAVKIANAIKKALLSGWEKGDFTELGQKMAKWITNALTRIPWEKIKKTLNKIAKSVATFLNGFLGDEELWKTVGTTISDGFNTSVSALYTFVTTLNWLQIGKNIATGINTAINRTDFTMAGKLLGAKMRGIIQLAFGTLTNIDYKTIGKKIGDFVNGFLDDMGKVDKNTGLTGWQELGKSISDGAKGILTTIQTALSTVKWSEVGKAIGQFLGSIDWVGVIGKVASLLATAISSLFETAISAIKEDPVGIITAITTLLGVVFAYKKLKSIKDIFKTLIGRGVQDGISNIPNSKLSGYVSSKFSKLGAISVALEVLATSVAFAKSAWKDVFDEYDTTEIYKAGQEMLKAGNKLGAAATGWGAILSGEFSFSEWANGISEWWEDLWSSDTSVKNIDYNLEQVKAHISEFGKSYNPVTGKTTIDTEKYEKQKKEYLKNLQKENPKLYKQYIEYEKRESELAKTTTKLSNTFKLFGNDSKTVQARISSLKNEVRQGTISLSSYKKIVNKSYKSNAEWVATLRDARIATKYTNGNLDEFNKIGNKLKITLGNVGISTKNVKSVIELLKGKIQDGTISFKEYKEICNGSYKTTDDLYRALNKVAGKKVEAEAKAVVLGKKDLDEFGNKITSIKSKDITITANAETATAEYKIKDLTTKKVVPVKFELGNTAKFSEKVRGALKGTNFKLTAAQIFPSKKQISEYFKGIVNSKEWKNAISFSPPAGKKVQANAKSKTVNIPKSLDIGGILSAPYKAMGWTVKYYAVGGYPDKGQMFVANEKGAELVGNLNGKTAVAPQDDIAAGFATAITNSLAPVMYSAFKQAATETAQTNGGDVYLDGKKVTESVISHINTISKSRGTSPIWGVS